MPTGINSYCNYGIESAFASAATADKSFGPAVKVSTVDRSSALNKIYGISSFDAQALLEGKFAGGMTVEFPISADMKWMKAVLGNGVTDAGAGPYTHTYPVDSSLVKNTPPSLTIEVGEDLDLSGTNETKHTFRGCVLSEFKLTAEVGDNPATVTLSFLYANEDKATNGAGSQVAEAELPFNFAMASFEVPSGVAIANTQRFEITVQRNPLLLWGLGSRSAVAINFGERSYEVRTVNYFDDSTLYLEKLFGGAGGVADTSSTSIATVVCKLSNDGWAAAQSTSRRMAWTFTTCKVQNIGMAYVCGEPIMEDVMIYPETSSVVVTNNTSTG